MADSSNDQRIEKINRIGLRMLALATLYFSTDCLLLFALSYTGIVSRGVVIAFGACGAVTIAVFLSLFKSGLNRCFRDPGMAAGQVFIGAMLQIVFLLAAPEVGVIFLVNLFAAFMFGVVALDSRQFRRLWSAVALAIAAAFILVGDRIGFPNTGGWSRLLMCLFFIFTLGQSVYLAGVISNLRLRLARKNRALTAALRSVEEIATRDALTDVPNRRALLEILDIERQAYRRGGKPFCIAMLDLDRFKEINDGFGHVTGDAVLKTFVSIVQHDLRPTDRLARYGGDEFVLVLVHTTGDEAMAALERVRAGVARHDWPSLAPGLAVTASIGYAVIEPGETVEQAFERADGALYAAKASGRNRVRAAAEMRQARA